MLTVWRRVPLHGPVPVVRVAALSVNVEEHVHVLERILRLHVRVAESGVVRLRVLPVQHRVRMMMRVVAYPAGLLRAHFHRFVFSKRSYTSGRK